MSDLGWWASPCFLRNPEPARPLVVTTVSSTSKIVSILRRFRKRSKIQTIHRGKFVVIRGYKETLIIFARNMPLNGNMLQNRKQKLSFVLICRIISKPDDFVCLYTPLYTPSGEEFHDHRVNCRSFYFMVSSSGSERDISPSLSEYPELSKHEEKSKKIPGAIPEWHPQQQFHPSETLCFDLLSFIESPSLPSNFSAQMEHFSGLLSVSSGIWCSRSRMTKVYLG